MEEEEGTQMRPKDWLFLGIFIFFFFLFAQYLRSIEAQKRQSYTGTAVGYSVRIIPAGDESELRYYFYVNRSRYLSEMDTYEYDDLHKYFVVRYNEKNPNESTLLLEEELKPDSLTLVNAGFTFTKKYIYDAISSSYKEESKWE